MKPDFSLERELDIMTKFSLDANHWFVLRSLFIAKDTGKTDYLFSYFTNCSKTGAPREILLNLKEKKILSKNYKIPEKGEPLNLDDLTFEPSFEKAYFKKSYECGKEIFEAYPHYLVMDNGKMLPARNLTSKIVFKTLDDFYIFYAKTIKYDAALHEKILNSLEFAKENDLIKSSLVEYCVSQKWLDHIESMEKNKLGEFNNYHDATKIV
jgi:hypothetical protein